MEKSPVQGGTESTASRLVKALLFTPVCVGVHFFALMFAIMLLVHARTDYLDFYEQLEIGLPPPTIAALRFTSWLNKFWYLLPLALFLFGAPLMFILQFAGSRYRRLSHFWFSGFLFFLLFVTFFTTYLLNAPLRHIRRELGDGRETAVLSVSSDGEPFVSQP